MEAKGIGELAIGMIVGGLEVISVGILLAIGFHLGAKIIEKIEDGKKMGKTKLARSKA